MSNQGKASRSRPPRKRKTAEKTPLPPLIPQPKGGALLAGGVPGNAGGGRPPKAFKDFLAELRKDPEAQEKLAAVAKDPTNKGCVAAWKLISDYDDERPAKKVEVSEPLSTAERRNRVQQIIDRVLNKGAA